MFLDIRYIKVLYLFLIYSKFIPIAWSTYDPHWLLPTLHCNLCLWLLLIFPIYTIYISLYIPPYLESGMWWLWNSYRIKILLIYLCGYYENNENILQYTTVYYQNTIFSTTWSYGKEGNLLINILYLFWFQGYWELLHIPFKKSLHYFSSIFPQL